MKSFTNTDESKRTRRLTKLLFGNIALVALVVLRVSDLVGKMNSWFKRPNMIIFRPISNRPVAIMAIWENEKLRKDVARFLNILESKEIDVILVNTGKLAKSEVEKLKCATYIERYNYGRDFGSYKCGFKFLQVNTRLEELPRLLFFNDSVFYADICLGDFVGALCDSDKPVLGATETFEVIHHLGSFCVSVGPSVLRNSRFEKFWSRYKPSNLRPVTIRRGEMQMSRILAQCSTSNPPLSAIYSASNVRTKIMTEPDLLILANNRGRVSSRNWNSSSLVHRVKSVILDLGISVEALVSQEVEFNVETADLHYVSSYTSGLEFVRKRMHGQFDDLEEVYFSRMLGVFLDEWINGSQIHQNATVLPLFGCPLVKLDIEYRGAAIGTDLENLLESIPNADRDYLYELIRSKPYGAACLRGWRKAAFLYGWL